ncbi:MAG: sulfite exporter TauE/SafE family protein [Chitinophagaceae bacterium]
MEIMGYAASLLIGLSLGLIGGGGSILTMPVLVYLFRISPLLATSYSLFVVGAVSLFGFIGHYKQKLVNLRVGFLFGSSSIATVFLTRHFLIPRLPAVLFMIDGFQVSTSLATMVLFALLMITAATAMIFSKRQTVQQDADKKNPLWLVVYGMAVGLVTGVLGAGGGFLLIPALVFFARLPMKVAVGTSLLIITLNSFFGVVSDLGYFEFDWWLLIRIVTIAFSGLVTGMYLSRFIPSWKLKKGFGWFVLAMGIYILLAELTK